MIIVEDVHKRYQTDHGPGKWVLQGVTFTIPPNSTWADQRKWRATESTCCIIGGVDKPTRGVERLSRVSWPMGFVLRGCGLAHRSGKNTGASASMSTGAHPNRRRSFKTLPRSAHRSTNRSKNHSSCARLQLPIAGV